MKRPGVWFLCVAWAVFAVTGLWLAVSAKVADLAATGVMALFFTTLFVGLGVFAARLPLDLNKLPHPDYWLTPEHLLEFKALIADLMYQLGAGIVLFVALINIAMFVQWGWFPYAIAVGLAAVLLAPPIRFNLQLDRIPRAGQTGTDGNAGSSRRRHITNVNVIQHDSPRHVLAVIAMRQIGCRRHSSEWIPPPHLDRGQPRTNTFHHPEEMLREDDEDGP